MKKIILITAMTILSLMAIAQNNDSIAVMEMIDNDITTFLGIPVTGTKSEVESKILAKGYEWRQDRSGTKCLYGQFNGKDVGIVVVTNHDKVYRIYIQYLNTMDEGDIKREFNNLVAQFEDNERYEKPEKDQRLGDNVDISYEMTCEHKRFIAEFYQKNKKIELSHIVVDGLNFQNKKVWFMISRQGTDYYIAMYYDNLWNMPNGEDL